MKWISVQIQPSATSDFDTKKFLQSAAAIHRFPEVDKHQEKNRILLSFHFFTENPKTLWQELKDNLFDNSDYGRYLKSISLVGCEDEEDSKVLLLHHFDSSEKLDDLM